MFVAWRDLRFAKGRFALMATVVVLMMLLVGLISGLMAGLAKNSTSAITGLASEHIAFSAPADGEDISFTESSVTPEVWRELAHLPGVRSADPIGISTARAEAAGGTASLSAFGVTAGSGLGPAPERISPGTTVLAEESADDLGVAAGDTIELDGRALTVDAVAGQDSFNHAPLAWVDLADWQEMAADRGSGGHGATVVALDTTGDADPAAADAELGTSTVARDDARHAIGSFNAENTSFQTIRVMLFAISALVIGAFFTVWTIQRSGDIAVLKALGATTPYLLRDALGQAIVLLALGIGTGTGLSVAAGAAISGILPFSLDLGTILLPTIVMTALGTVGAGLAIRRITSVDPLTALGSAR